VGGGGGGGGQNDFHGEGVNTNLPRVLLAARKTLFPNTAPRNCKLMRPLITFKHSNSLCSSEHFSLAQSLKSSSKRFDKFGRYSNIVSVIDVPAVSKYQTQSIFQHMSTSIAK